MSLEYFQLLDTEPFDNIIKKREFLKVYHQQGAQINQSHQNIDFLYGEKNNSHQIGNSFLKFDITVRRDDTTNFHRENPIRLVSIVFAFCLKEACLSATIGSGIEHDKFCEQVSTIMKIISKKYADMSSQFDKINENDIPFLSRINDLPPEIRSTLIKKY